MIKIKQDLTGRIFGKLNVIKRVEDKIYKNGSKDSQWLCQCECGSAPFKVAGGSLKSGNTRSCGCLSFQDLTGMVFGRLTVLKQVRRQNSTSAYWECECSCGSEHHPILSTTELRSGRTKSCGCLAKEIASLVHKKYNTYDLSGEYGIGWTSNTNKKFYFDVEDYDLIKGHCWFENDQGYIVTKDRDEYFAIRMHRLVLGLQKGDPIVDHKNTKRYDNRKNNLRFSDKQTNGINRGANKNNKLGIKGVYQLKNGHYQAKIQYFDKIYTKSSSSLDEVVEWRNNKEKELYGEFAYINEKENDDELQQPA